MMKGQIFHVHRPLSLGHFSSIIDCTLREGFKKEEDPPQPPAITKIKSPP